MLQQWISKSLASPPGLELNRIAQFLRSCFPQRSAGSHFLVIFSILVSGCLDSGSSSSTSDPKSGPGAARFSQNPARYVIHEPIPPNTILSAGRPEQVTIQPTLPAGLSLDAKTGEITGTPSLLSETTIYQVRISNGYGVSYTSLTLTVGHAAPVITLSTTSLTGSVGQTLTPLMASNSGGPISNCITAPTLPAGLQLVTSSSSCLISGTPTEPFERTITLTAASQVRSDSQSFFLSILDRKPQLSFSNPLSIARNSPAALLLPSNSGGKPTQCASSPSLPSGLLLRSDCAITGNPLTLSASTPYLLTASNSGGTATATLSLSVIDRIPEFYFDLPHATLTLTKGSVTASVAPIVTAGFIESCSATPALPTGLALSSTCILSGTPSVTQSDTTHWISATNSAGSSSYPMKIRVSDKPPRFSYAVSTLVFANRAAVSISPTHSGGTSLSCLAQPSLPAGLSLDAECRILGSPTQASSLKDYSIQATNSGGSWSRSIQISITEIAPLISYSPSSLSETLALPITSVSASNAGGAIVSCSSQPTLPVGLTLSAQCQIQGTPLSISPAAPYVIRATNSVGSSSFTLSIQVVDRPPQISYPAATRILRKNEPLSAWTPTNTGGLITSCAIAPDLPSGLVFSALDCAISGSPIAISPQTTYTISATNSGGTGTSTISLTVNDIAPLLQFMPGSAKFTLQSSGFTLSASNLGGAVLQCSSQPALPTGLATTPQGNTCIISGTPTSLSPQTGYTITGTNSGGPSSTLLEISVVDPAPQIRFEVSVATFTRTQLATPWSALNEGGPLSTCTSTPALPPGLALSSQCVISGTPTTLSTAQPYLITGSNSGGSSQASVTLSVLDLPPVISVTPNTVIGRIGLALNTISVEQSGGSATTFSLSGPLPSGLTWNSSLGILSGTPTQSLYPESWYTITASNSGGSSSATFRLQVNELDPQILYSVASITLTKNQAISPLVPSLAQVASLSLQGSLPLGLEFNSSTGAISGTPSAIQATTSISVTGLNSTGQSTTATLGFRIVDEAPQIAFQGGPYFLVVHQALASLAPVRSGGNITDCSSEPALPAGLSIDSNCTISGTPNTLSAAAAYTIRASNSGGSNSQVITLSVISDTPEPPNAFLRWISLSDLTGIWNGTAALEARLWKARADGSSRLLHPSLLVSWKALDLVQPPRLAPNQSYWIAVSNRALSGDPLDPALPCSNLWKVSIDGTQWTPLTTSTDAGEDNLDPAISPDSASIAFASKQKLPASPLSFNLWTISASGSSLTARTQETEAGVDSREPAFSPSGAQLVFSSLKRIAADLPASYNLWKLTLATDTATPFSATLALGSDRRQARFSNDGTKIIYVSNRPLTQGGSSTASMNLWSTSSQQLQETALTLNTSANQDISAPEFSGNDRYIAYESLVPISGTSSASRNIWVLDSVSSTHTPITRNTDPGLSSRLLPGSTW